MTIPNPCCCTCILMFDEFGSSLSSDWEQIDGTWSNSGGYLTTTSTDALIVHETEVPANAGKLRVRWHSEMADPATAGYRLIAYKDSSNYAYLEVKSNAVTGPTDQDMKLGYFSGGVETVLRTATLNVGAAGYVRLCWDGVRLVGGFDNMALNGPYTAPDNLRPGFATPSTGTSWEFDAAWLEYHNEERGSCPGCRTCWDLCETFPESIEVYIPAGMFASRAFAGGDDWFCNGGCEALNDQTYVLDLVTDGDIDDNDDDFLVAGLGGQVTGCPKYLYVEEEFCDIENPARAGSYSATLRIIARFLAGAEGGTGMIQVMIHIASECEGGRVPFTNGCVYPDSHGNVTSYYFNTNIDGPTNVGDLPNWDACVEREYDTLTIGDIQPSSIPGDVWCESRQVSTLPLPPGTTCIRTGLACDVSETEVLTIYL